jgi:hypothetical protein
MKLMVKEESTDKKEEEAKRINFILWGIGNRLSSLGVIASSEWDVGDKLDLEHPESNSSKSILIPRFISPTMAKRLFISPRIITISFSAKR